MGGSNGCGKSTLLQLIMGLLKPVSGTIALFGRPRDTENDFRTARLQIGFVFQDANDQLFCPTVGDDLAFGLLNMGLSRDEANQIVDETLTSLKLAVEMRDGFPDKAVCDDEAGNATLTFYIAE